MGAEQRKLINIRHEEGQVKTMALWSQGENQSVSLCKLLRSQPSSASQLWSCFSLNLHLKLFVAVINNWRVHEYSYNSHPVIRLMSNRRTVVSSSSHDVKAKGVFLCFSEDVSLGSRSITE